MRKSRSWGVLWGCVCVCFGVFFGASDAEAFCGFYVGGAGATLYNSATHAVLMRKGNQTVLSMQNDYRGPPSDFAMVIPVPVVLEKDDVKTLPKGVFAKLDQMSAPRLVEYWEQDPCQPTPVYKGGMGGMGSRGSGAGGGGYGRGLGKVSTKVRVRRRFVSGEYEVVILSATESAALETWLRQNQYNLPKGAAKVMAPYIEQGMYFFVAKVNADKVKFDRGRAVLSPLRFRYTSDSFSLPVRLGLLNAQGPQDLIVHILAKAQRYEVANAKHVTIPTNLNVIPATKKDFGSFYRSLFDRTIQKNPRSVVTEYAWDASTCDPCPGPRLGRTDLEYLGADVLDGMASGLVLTRLHTRYTSKTLKQDLVFRAAPAIQGGRQVFAPRKEKKRARSREAAIAEILGAPSSLDMQIHNPFGGLSGVGFVGPRLVSSQEWERLERGVRPGGVNMFQGRYIVRHPWVGSVECSKPSYGRWGAQPNAGASSKVSVRSVPRQRQEDASSGDVRAWLRDDIPELGVRAFSKHKLRKR